MNLREKRKLFMDELEELERKYDAEINTGCGCCGGGIYINNHEVTDNSEDYSKIEVPEINEN